MDRIVRRVEKDPLYRGYLDAYHAEAEHTAADAITLAAREVASTMRAAAIVTYTTTGSTALRAARERPGPADSGADEPGRHRAAPGDALGLALYRLRGCQGTSTRWRSGRANMRSRRGIGQAGSSLVITAGVPFGTPGATNLLRIAWIV